MTGRTMAAERMKRYRKRLRDGLLAIRTEVSANTLDKLIATGLLPAEKIDDPRAVGAALARAVDAWARDAKKSVMA